MSKVWELLEARDANIPQLTPLSALEMAKWAVTRSGVGRMADTITSRDGGRPRKLPLSAFLILWVAAALTAQTNRFCLTTVKSYAQTLSPKKLRSLGVTGDAVGYHQIYWAHKRLAQLLDEGSFNHPHHLTVDLDTGEAAPCPPDCPQVFTHDDWGTRLAVAGVLPSMITTAIAIDATDQESWAHPQSWDNDPDVEPGQLPGPEDVKKRRLRSKQGWPRIGADGRKQHTLDPDARQGFRTSKKGRKGEVFTGYDLTFGVITRLCNNQGYVLPLILCLSVRPGGTHKGRSGIDAVDALLRAGLQVTEVVADRGYTYCTHDTWATPLRERGINQTLDLHPLQRGRRPGPIPGTVWVDGALYTSAIPDSLIDLPGRPLVHDFAVLGEWAEQYEPRRPYRYIPLSAPAPDGSQRFKGPALSGKVRCPNTPASMRGKGPLARCQRGEVCGCGKTVTIGPTVEARERQHFPYGTNMWMRDYSRREHVESVNSALKGHQSLLRHGSIQVLGTVKTAMAVGIAALVHNLLAIRSLRARAAAPPQTYTEADEDLSPLIVKRRARKPAAKPPPD